MDATTVEGYTRVTGADTEETFRQALADHGSDSKLGGDGQWMSNCPSHPDRTASLHWKKTANQAVVFHCFAGCDRQSIVDALSIRFYQLKPVRQEFDYFDREGTYRFTVRRTNTADGGKRVTQYQRQADGGEEDGNGLEPGESFLWLEPELESFAEDHRSAGKKFTLWVPEGEKDVLAIAGSGSLGENDFVTTAPGGAGNWKPAHNQRIIDLYERDLLSAVVVVCDDDPAGAARGFAIRDGLSMLEDLPVALKVAQGDVADLCDQFEDRWVEYLEELSEAEIITKLEEGSAVTNGMLRTDLGPGVAPGRKGMGIRVVGKDSEYIALVLGGEVLPIQQWGGGWIVRVTGPRREPVEAILTHADLTAKTAFDKWLASVGIAMPPRSGFGADSVAASLRMWLSWWCDVHKVETVVVSPYLTWVDPKTGEPARIVGRDDPVWVSPDEIDHGVRWIGADEGGNHWGREGTELDAAWAMARALSFGDEATVTAVAGWAGAMILSPWLGRWMPTKPGLAVIAPSGSGKTYGAPRLLLQLAGCDGNSTSSVAGLRRRLAQGGVSSIQWIDDSAILDDYHLKEILRVATSQGEHTLANPDAGATATQTAKLLGCVVVSAEGVAWMDETAMADRFLHVRPANPQGRHSLRGDRGGELQWGDVQDLMVEWNSDLTQLARWVVEGVASDETRALLPKWTLDVGAPKGRGDVAAFAVAIGARAVAAWLHGAKRRTGADWPGKADKAAWGAPVYNNWKWLVDEGDQQLRDTRDQIGSRFNTLVSTVLPAVLRGDLTGVTGKGMTGLVLGDVDGRSENGLRRSVHNAVQMGKQAESALPIILMDTDGFLWVWINGASSWYERTHRNKSETRITGAKALNDQLGVYEDTPEWATWTDNKAKDRSYQRPGIRVGKREIGRNRAIYRRLSKEASAAVVEAV